MFRENNICSFSNFHFTFIYFHSKGHGQVENWILFLTLFSKKKKINFSPPIIKCLTLNFFQHSQKISLIRNFASFQILVYGRRLLVKLIFKFENQVRNFSKIKGFQFNQNERAAHLKCVRYLVLVVFVACLVSWRQIVSVIYSWHATANFQKWIVNFC